MPAQSSPDPGAPGDADWPDDDWDDADDAEELRPPWPGGAPPRPTPPAWSAGGPGKPPRSGTRRWLIIAAVAVVAAAAGVGVTIGVRGSLSSGGAVAPAPGTGSGNGFLPSGGNGNGNGNGEQMLAAGEVTAVSGTSITVSGNGSSITAAITSATQFTGAVKIASGIKVGDLVMLDISVNGTADTAASIQDPFSGSGSLP